MIRGWVEGNLLHGSAWVMLPDGQMFGRVLRAGQFEPDPMHRRCGQPFAFLVRRRRQRSLAEVYVASHLQAFDEGDDSAPAATDGCCCRGFGHRQPRASSNSSGLVSALLSIIDGDHVEDRNVNRILNSTMKDAELRRAKVDVQKDAIERMARGHAASSRSRKISGTRG